MGDIYDGRWWVKRPDGSVACATQKECADEIKRLRDWLELIADDRVKTGVTRDGQFVERDHSAAFARAALAGKPSPLADDPDV